mmetsp:Transcript_127639/g.369522  ORF Transcript_127639/g.369522 Transcript_127639/m.369522 type:complete len:610 (-) Transcript_127639:516-2345(-)
MAGEEAPRRRLQQPPGQGRRRSAPIGGPQGAITRGLATALHGRRGRLRRLHILRKTRRRGWGRSYALARRQQVLDEAPRWRHRGRTLSGRSGCGAQYLRCNAIGLRWGGGDVFGVLRVAPCLVREVPEDGAATRRQQAVVAGGRRRRGDRRRGHERLPVARTSVQHRRRRHPASNCGCSSAGAPAGLGHRRLDRGAAVLLSRKGRPADSLHPRAELFLLSELPLLLPSLLRELGDLLLLLLLLLLGVGELLPQLVDLGLEPAARLEASLVLRLQPLLLILPQHLCAEIDGAHSAGELQRVARGHCVAGEWADMNEEQYLCLAEGVLQKHGQPRVSVGHKALPLSERLDDIGEGAEALIDGLGLCQQLPAIIRSAPVHIFAARQVHEDELPACRHAPGGEHYVGPRGSFVAECGVGGPRCVPPLKHLLRLRETIDLHLLAVQQHPALQVPPRALQRRRSETVCLRAQQVADLVAIDLHHRELGRTAVGTVQQLRESVLCEPNLAAAISALQGVGLPGACRAVGDDARRTPAVDALDPRRGDTEDVLLLDASIENSVHSELPAPATIVLDRDVLGVRDDGAPVVNGLLVGIYGPDSAHHADRRDGLSNLQA